MLAHWSRIARQAVAVSAVFAIASVAFSLIVFLS